MQRHLLTCLLALFSCWVPVLAQNENDDDFVNVSLLVADPSDILFSSVGHACLRLQCPTHNLDYCFSYEGENVHGQFLRFFAGRLKMGMAAIPSDEYIQLYKKDQRAVHQYDLTLPIDVKKRLWEILDNRVAEGMNLPYDYIKRGCAQSILQVILQAMGGSTINWGTWSEHFQLTRRELVASSLPHSPWSRLCLYTIVGTEADANCSPLQRVVIPADLVEVLHQATIDETPIIQDEPQALTPLPAEGWFTPLLLACIIWLATFLCWWFKRPFATWALLTLQTLLGLFLVYAVFIAHLPANEWNWLLVPFNPIPALFWHWRRYWARPYVLILTAWILGMLLWPHQLTDPAYIILTAALLPTYMPRKKQETSHK